MGLLKYAESKIRAFTIIDIASFKICLIAFSLMVAKLWPGILALDWYWYAIIFAASYAWLLAKMFRKDRR